MIRANGRRGMTLLEVLVVIAIIALVMVALLAYLWPTDDRRCRSEAERLAAWLMGTRAESVMREGPVRAAFDFSDQTVIRELGREGASLAHVGFDKDPRAEVFTTRAPVKFTMLRIPVLGDLSTATAWMVFSDYQTVGGVVVLELNEAVYSVVVGPGREGEVQVVPGKAEVLKAPPGRAGNLFAVNGFELDNSPFPSEFMPTVNPGTVTDSPPPVVPPVDPPAEEDPPVVDPPVNDPIAPPIDPPVEDDEEDLPPEEDDEEEPECRVPDKPCEGRFEGCVEGKCAPAPMGLGLRVNAVRVLQPAAVAQVLQPLFQKEVMLGRFNLAVRFDYPVDPGQASGPYMATVVQAAAGPSGVMYANPRLPVYSQLAGPAQTCASGFTHCYDFQYAESMGLYLFRGNPLPGECDFNAFFVTGHASAYLNIPPKAAMAAQISGVVTIQGKLLAEVARDTKFVMPNSQVVRLDEALAQYGAPPDLDTNDDGTPDAWSFVIEGNATGVELGYSAPAPNRDPCN